LRNPASGLKLPPGVALGCGVTAYGCADATGLVHARVFGGIQMPEIAERADDVDISTLDMRHVVPNMGAPSSEEFGFR